MQRTDNAKSTPSATTSAAAAAAAATAAAAAATAAAAAAAAAASAAAAAGAAAAAAAAAATAADTTAAAAVTGTAPTAVNVSPAGIARSQRRQAVPQQVGSSKEDDEPHRCCKLCTVRRAVVRTFPGVTDPNRKAMLALHTKLWAPGSTLTWAFMPDGAYHLHGEQKFSMQNPEWMTAVRDAFDYWQGLGIPIKFQEITDPNQAVIRVTFFLGESWSHTGRDITNVPLREPTMNIGSMELDTTALHEVGHVLGLEHEHQSPCSRITWNVPAVMEYAASMGLSPEMASQQILSRVNANNPAGPLLGTAWDPTSIMHYPFPAECIDAPEPFATDGIPEPAGLSNWDIETIRRLYPADRPRRLKERQPIALHDVVSGSVHAFEIIPNKTQKYRIEKFGGDAILVLLDINGQKIKADDDAGEERDGKIDVPLEKDVRYVLNLRIAHVEPDDNTVTVMLKPLSS